MQQPNIILKTFETPLGTVNCGLAADSTGLNMLGQNSYENGQSAIYATAGHRVELIEFKIREAPADHGSVKDSKGWIWKIKKLNDVSEELTVYCLFENPVVAVEFDAASGERLDAIEVFNDNWRLYIGTEDGEALNSRAENEDEFPARLVNKVDFYNSITKTQQTGFKSVIPALNKNEIIHLQYLSAYQKKIEGNLDAWFAVDQEKRRLDNWIGIPW